MLNHDVTFNLGSAKVCSHAILETHFSYNIQNDLRLNIAGVGLSQPCCPGSLCCFWHSGPHRS